MNAWYLSLDTCLFSSEVNFFACKLRNKNEYQLTGVQGEGLYYSTERLPNQATLSVLSSIPWSDYLVSGVGWHSTHWRLLVFSIKYGQSNAQFTRGSWSWRLYGRNGLRTWGRSSKKNEFVSIFRSIFQSISIDFCLFFRIILYCRNADRYRTILYSRNDLRGRIRWVATACIVDKMNEWMRVFCLFRIVVFVVLCCTITSYSNYCTVQKQIGDERMKPNCLHDSDRVSGQNWWRSGRNGTFTSLLSRNNRL